VIRNVEGLAGLISIYQYVICKYQLVFLSFNYNSSTTFQPQNTNKLLGGQRRLSKCRSGFARSSKGTRNYQYVFKPPQSTIEYKTTPGRPKASIKEEKWLCPQQQRHKKLESTCSASASSVDSFFLIRGNLKLQQFISPAKCIHPDRWGRAPRLVVYFLAALASVKRLHSLAQKQPQITTLLVFV
jgi:hypothetical protein